MDQFGIDFYAAGDFDEQAGSASRPRRGQAGTSGAAKSVRAQARTRVASALKGSRAKELPASIQQMTLEQAQDITAAVWTVENLYPDATRADALARLAVLCQRAANRDTTTLGQLIDGAAGLLTAVHAPMLRNRPVAGFLKSAEADLLHRDRNLLLALVMTVAINQVYDPRPAMVKFLKLQRRTNDESRPACDDEIVLFRLYRWAGAQSGDVRRIRGGLSYTLMESGGRAYEAAQCTLDWFDRMEEPRMFQAPGIDEGATRIDARELDFEPFTDYLASYSLRRLQEIEPGREYLVYDGDHVGARASIGQYRACADMFADLGLCNGRSRDLTATSISLWRAKTAYANNDLITAMNITGMTKTRTLEMLQVDGVPPLDGQTRARSF